MPGRRRAPLHPVATVEWWLAAAAPAASAAWLVSTGGLSSFTRGRHRGVFAAVVLLFLVLGRRAVGQARGDGARERPDLLPPQGHGGLARRSSSCSAWSSLWSQFDVDWMKDNFCFIAGGLKYTILLAVFAIVLARHPGAARRARAALEEPGRVRRLRLLHVVLPWHAADRAAVPDLPGAAADRARTSAPPVAT